MDLEPIEERANEFATWVGKFDSAHRIPAAFASAADVPALLAEVRRLREKIDVDRAMFEAFRPEVVAEVAVLVCDEMDWQAVATWCGGTIDSTQGPSGEYTSTIDIPGVGSACEGMWIVQRHDGTFAIRATLEGPSAESVARLTARPAPAWDEEAVRGALVDAQLASACRMMHDGHPSIFIRSNEDAADTALAVVRDHLPVKPRREDMVEAMLGSDILTDDLRAEASAQGSTQREPFLCFADAVLDLWPGRSEAEVAEKAWDEGVAVALNHAIRNEDGITLRLEHLDGRPWANPYREGGAS